MKITKKCVVIHSIIFAAVLAGAGITAAKLHVFEKADGRGGLETPGPEFDLEGFSSMEDGMELVQDTPELSVPALTYESYRVEPGDMVGVIAERFGITQDTIISMNNIRQSRLLQVGQYLKIPSMTGILYTVKKDGETVAAVAESYKVDAVKCAQVNNLKESSELKAGETLFVPDAALDWVTRQEINGDLFTIPIHGRYYLSSYFGWRSSPFSGKRSYHGGVDLAIGMGTPVYAALTGKVTATGFNATYGNYVIVAHHSGYKTLYGHLSQILVTQGKSVSTSSVIGRVGNTGLSTGPHLHFAVYKNGKGVNPLNLVR